MWGLSKVVFSLAIPDDLPITLFSLICKKINKSTLLRTNLTPTFGTLKVIQKQEEHFQRDEV